MCQYTDHMGLVITTVSAEAAARYAEGLRLLTDSSPDAGAVLYAAVVADPSLGVAVAALVWRGDVHVDALDRYLEGPSLATRRERQHIEIVAVALRGGLARARALGLDHLRDFPGDVLVTQVLARPDATG
jgi:hypothetical protein